jgi:hypothetical protein
MIDGGQGRPPQSGIAPEQLFKTEELQKLNKIIALNLNLSAGLNDHARTPVANRSFPPHQPGHRLRPVQGCGDLRRGPPSLAHRHPPGGAGTCALETDLAGDQQSGESEAQKHYLLRWPKLRHNHG